MHIVARHSLSEAENLRDVSKEHVELGGHWWFVVIDWPRLCKPDDYIFICAQGNIMGYGVVFEIHAIDAATAGETSGILWRRAGQILVRYEKLRWFDEPIDFKIKKVWRYINNRTAKRILRSGLSKEVGAKDNILG